jgi:hypothetical protein
LVYGFLQGKTASLFYRDIRSGRIGSRIRELISKVSLFYKYTGGGIGIIILQEY